MATEAPATNVTYLKTTYLNPLIEALSVIWLETLIFSVLVLTPYAPTWLTDSFYTLAMATWLFPSNLSIWLWIDPLIFALTPIYTSVFQSPAVALVANLLYYIPYAAFFLIYLIFILQSAMMIYYSVSGLCIITYDFLASCPGFNIYAVAPWLVLTLPSLWYMPCYTIAAAIFVAYRANIQWNRLFQRTATLVGKAAVLRDFEHDDDTAEMPSKPDGTQRHDQCLLTAGTEDGHAVIVSFNIPKESVITRVAPPNTATLHLEPNASAPLKGKRGHSIALAPSNIREKPAGEGKGSPSKHHRAVTVESDYSSERSVAHLSSAANIASEVLSDNEGM